MNHGNESPGSIALQWIRAIFPVSMRSVRVTHTVLCYSPSGVLISRKNLHSGSFFTENESCISTSQRNRYQRDVRKPHTLRVIISPHLAMRLLFFSQAAPLRHYPCKNIAFVQAFLYLSSYLEIHLIARIRLESAPVGDQSSGPVRHEKSGPPGILRSASFLRACPTIPEIERCPRKNNTGCHLAAAVSHALPPWHRSIGACLRCEGNSTHPLDLFLICPLEAWLLLAAELHQQSISARSS